MDAFYTLFKFISEESVVVALQGRCKSRRAQLCCTLQSWRRHKSRVILVLGSFVVVLWVK